MTDGSERRQHPRKASRQDVFCYIDGNRFDACSEDLSAGGMFLRTDGLVDVAVGTIVGLVVKGIGDLSRAVYLFARVARQQTAPVIGIGLQWEKAVSIGGPEVLIQFLETVLGITSPVLTQRAVAGKDFVRHVYAFNPQRAPDAADALPPAPPVIPASARPASNPGAITTQIQVLRAVFPVDLVASASFEGLNLPVRIRRIGVAAMFVETRVAPLDVSTPIRILIPTSAGEGAVIVAVRCRINEARVQPKDPETGLVLEVLDIDEGSDTGAWQRFLKRLHFRTLAQD
jgi:hypothetical protein